MSSAQPERGQLIWRKARRSMNHGDCVEVAAANKKIAVRDSKNPDGSWMICSPRCWQAFVEKIKVG
jgi:Domain of unknown function (DUF397)